MKIRAEAADDAGYAGVLFHVLNPARRPLSSKITLQKGSIDGVSYYYE